MIPTQIVNDTAARYEERRRERAETERKLDGGSPLQADTPERVSKRISHMATSEMARATALPAERLVGASASPGGTVNVLERIIGRNDLMSVTFLDMAVNVARTVARIQIRNRTGQLVGYGTGFMIGPRVLITNNHVLETAQAAADSQAEFNYQDAISGLASPTAVFRLDPEALFLTDTTLDYTIVAVRPGGAAADLESFGYNQLLQQEGKVLIGECLNIIQHPNGEPKQLALRENQLIDLMPQFMHYHTDTAPGSSGSAVFNDQWEVVGLHHSGVPHTDAQGRYLTKDGQLWTAAMGEHKIDWIANEGVRISQIVAGLKDASGLTPTARSLRDSVLSPRSPIETLSRGQAAPDLAVRRATSPQVTFADGTVKVSGLMAIELTGRLLGVDVPPAALALGHTPAVVDAPPAQALEKMVVPAIDTNYATRRGYRQDFLGVPVPLPDVKDLTVVARMDDDKYVIPYQHFSVVMHKKRRLPLFTASNVDGGKAAKQPEAGRDYSRKGLGGLGPNDSERWTTDPRIREEHQLPDVFFTKDRQSFDKGHIVRREDVCHGTSYAMVRRANGDTFHTPNCSPQVKGFNQAGAGGLWGELENVIMKQAKQETYCIFAGPVLSADDEEFEGVDERGPVKVRIPSRYWKVVVAREGAAVQAFAFVLEQDLTAVDFREFAVDAFWTEHMVSVKDLEDMLGNSITFPAIVKAGDQFATPAGKEIMRNHLESVRAGRSGTAVS